MSQFAAPYTFEDLPLASVPPGTTLLVAGRGRIASKLARRLTLGGWEAGEGAIFVSTNATGSNLATECTQQYPDLDADGLAIVDATGRAATETDTGARIGSVSNTGDLTGISIELSILYSAMQADGYERIRNCFDSLSLLLLYTNPKTITRFVHTITGRVSATDGISVFVLDPSMHDQRVVYTLEHICDGRIDVQAGADGLELRADGVPGEPLDWTPVDL